ncbi:hypothetical protein MTO96_051744 [Rhipicephalus appendiculatus]
MCSGKVELEIEEVDATILRKFLSKRLSWQRLGESRERIFHIVCGVLGGPLEKHNKINNEAENHDYIGQPAGLEITVELSQKEMAQHWSDARPNAKLAFCTKNSSSWLITVNSRLLNSRS